MADDKRKKDPEFRLRCVWKYPRLDKADFGTQKFPKPAGEFSVQGIVKADDAEAKRVIEALTPLYKEAEDDAKKAFKELKVETRKKLEKVKMNDLFTTLYDQETEEPTGEISFKFAMAASGEYERNGKKTKWTAKPRIFDGKGQLIVKVPEIWGGSEGIVAFSARPYFIKGTGAAGLKLKLLAAQITKLVQGGGRDASGYGFGSEEGGYEHQDSIGDDTSSTDDDADSADQTSDTTSSSDEEDF